MTRADLIRERADLVEQLAAVAADLDQLRERNERLLTGLERASELVPLSRPEARVLRGV